MIIKEQIDVAEKNLERLLSHIKSVDNKCVLLLGINTAMLGILANSALSYCYWNLFMCILTMFTTLMLLTSLILTLLGSYPQTKDPKKSLISFDTITGINYEKFKECFLMLSDEDYINDLLKQCYRNSEILGNKYLRLKIAFILLFIELIPWAFNIYLFKYK